MSTWMENVLEVVLMALSILTFQLLVIILGLRYGLFLWIIKKILQLRATYLQNKAKKKENLDHGNNEA